MIKKYNSFSMCLFCKIIQLTFVSCLKANPFDTMNSFNHRLYKQK